MLQKQTNNDDNFEQTSKTQLHSLMLHHKVFKKQTNKKKPEKQNTDRNYNYQNINQQRETIKLVYRSEQRASYV